MHPLVEAQGALSIVARAIANISNVGNNLKERLEKNEATDSARIEPGNTNQLQAGHCGYVPSCKKWRKSCGIQTTFSIYSQKTRLCSNVRSTHSNIHFSESIMRGPVTFRTFRPGSCYQTRSPTRAVPPWLIP